MPEFAIILRKKKTGSRRNNATMRHALHDRRSQYDQQLIKEGRLLEAWQFDTVAESTRVVPIVDNPLLCDDGHVTTYYRITARNMDHAYALAKGMPAMSMPDTRIEVRLINNSSTTTDEYNTLTAADETSNGKQWG